MNIQCPICWESLDEINYYYLPCKHLICEKCYTIFIKRYKNCCLCRRGFRHISVKLIKFIPKRHGKNWTNVEEFMLIDLYLDSQSIDKIALSLKRTERAIINKLGKLKNTELCKLDDLRRERLENKLEMEREEALRILEIEREETLRILEEQTQGLEDPPLLGGYQFAFKYTKYNPIIIAMILAGGVYLYNILHQ